MAPHATPARTLLRITDAVGMVDRPLRALQAVEQLMHPSSCRSGSSDLSLLDRESLAYLLTVIYLDFERTLCDVRSTMQGERA